MESKEALKRIELAPVCECDDYDGEPYTVGTVNNSFEYDIKIVKKDLDRLEKQNKAIEIIKTKQVDINEFIKYINSPLFNDTNVKAIDYYNLLHMNGLSQEEWDLLKEVFR